MEKETNSQNLLPYEVHHQDLHTMKELLSTLPKEHDINGSEMYQYKGFWFWPMILTGAMSSQKHFQAQDNDIILATFMKSGTTWLKALTYAIVHRDKYPVDQSPILTNSPYTLVPMLEVEFYKSVNEFEHLPTPRVLSTHVPYSFLPNLKNCRVVYLCRNPLDQLVSYWHFMVKVSPDGKQLSMEDLVERICNGIQPYGPIWDHSLGYWNASSKEKASNILFLKYEDLKKDTIFYIEKLADFLCCSFSDTEKEQGIPENIAKLCSIENMTSYKTNNKILPELNMSSSLFFRKGEVGDWRNYLTPTMWKRLKDTVEEKLSGSSLTFQMS